MEITILQLIYLFVGRPDMNLMKKLIIQENLRVAYIALLKQIYLKYLPIFDNWDTLLRLLILMAIPISLTT